MDQILFHQLFQLYLGFFLQNTHMNKKKNLFLVFATMRPKILNAAKALAGSPRIAAITGAGVSTFSGIPDYRSPGRPPHRPLMHSEFLSSERNRQRSVFYGSNAFFFFFTLSLFILFISPEVKNDSVWLTPFFRFFVCYCVLSIYN